MPLPLLYLLIGMPLPSRYAPERSFTDDDDDDDDDDDGGAVLNLTSLLSGDNDPTGEDDDIPVTSFAG
jgi:hypothetical protein